MKLTIKAKQRIEIAKDALKHLKAKRIAANRGAVLSFSHPFKLGASLQKVFKAISRKKEQCQVCARGALFYAHIWRNNKFKTFYNIDLVSGVVQNRANEDYSCPVEDRIEKFFEVDQLALIERAFEGMHNELMLTSEEMELADKFHDEYLTDEARLEAILLNIISNNGEFVLV